LMASELNASIASLENDWANAYYQPDEASQKQAYPKLLEQAVVLLKRYPNAAEPKIWLATILATNAAFEPPLTALSNLKNAKDLLEAAIKINPKALDGSAYVTLGTLYYMLPGWPVSFGDDEMAEEYLKSSLEINPDGIDANYFYADFLFRQDRTAEAEVFFQKAVEAPVRKMQVYADTQLQNEAKLALNHAQQRKSNAEKNRFQALFTTASIGSK
jgi:tetratricopeptide (TPR) repeat protein